ncbi:hypothetical protein B5F77_05480 [Parabacteroides sp. An277]|nr:hypothetical protein B5F77_05480 [Parabacteroides sp. An277]
MQKNQKIRLTLQRLQIRFAPLKSRKTRFAQTAEIFSRSAWNLLYASFVRPVWLHFHLYKARNIVSKAMQHCMKLESLILRTCNAARD